MKKPLQSVFKPIFKAVLGVSKWWSSLHPLASFAYDLVNGRYMRSGGASTQALSLTDDRASSALVLQGNGSYVERYGPRTYLGVNRDMTTLTRGPSTIVTPMPDEVDINGNKGTVYRVQMPASGATYLMLAGSLLDGAEYTSGFAVKRFSLTETDFTMQFGSFTGPRFTATENWEEYRHGVIKDFGQEASFLNNGDDTFGSDLLVCLLYVFEGLDDLPYYDTNGVTQTLPAELAIGQGVGGQLSQTVTNYVPAPDMTGAVVGVPGTMPIGWTASNYVSGVQREIVAVGERDGLPTIHLRFFGQWDAGHPGYSNISMGAVSSMPITENDQIAQGTHIALVGGSLGPVSNMNLNAYYRLSGAYKGQTSTYLKNDITSELKRLTAVDTSLSPTGGTCDAAELALYFHVPPETPFDFTIEIAAPFLSPVAFVPPVNIGSGTTTTRAADNPVVVQGLGDETVVDAMSPADWDPINASLTPNGDGSANIASIGEFYHRSGSSSEAWQAGVLQRGFFEFEAGTSGAGLIVLRNVDTANVYAQAAGYVGALTVTHDTGCTFVITSQTESNGVHRLEYEFTSDFDVTNTQVAFGPNTDAVGNDVKLKKGGLSVVLPYPGYNADGTLSGRELVEGGGFDTQEEVDLWSPTNATKALSNGRMRLTNTVANFGFAFLSTPSTEGRVYRAAGERADKDLTASIVDVHVGAFENSTAYAANAEWTAGPFVFLSQYDDVRITAIVGGNTLGAWKEFDNISLQEIEPGVIIECTGVWGSSNNQRVMRLDDGSSNNYLEVRRESSGKIKLIYVKDGVQQISITQSTVWPADQLATFRLELTNTEGGFFFALFLDDEYQGLSGGPFEYAEAINELDISPVSGVKTIKQVYGK